MSCAHERIALQSATLPGAARDLAGALARLLGCLAWGGYHAVRLLGRCLLGRLRGGPTRPSLFGATLAELFESLGGGFLKFGQILSTRVDLLPEEVLTPMRRLRDHVRPMSPATTIAVIEKSLGRPLWELFAEFDATPTGSASIAQVHRAILRDTGDEVAVKVRRPGIELRVATDARLILAGAWALGLLPWFRGLPLCEAVREVNRSLVAQTDFVAEAVHLRRFHLQSQNAPAVRIPRVVHGWCSADVVTMEYIPGSRALDDQAVDHSIRRAATIVALRTLYSMIFEFGYFHCDPHPANLRIGHSGEVVLLDFGFVSEFPPGHRRAFAQFFVSIATQNAALAAEIVRETALSIPDDFDAVGFDSSLARLIQACAGRRVGQFQIVRFVGRLFAIQREYGLLGSPHFTLAILTLLAFEGVLKAVAPDLDFQQEAVPILLRGLAR